MTYVLEFSHKLIKHIIKCIFFVINYFPYFIAKSKFSKYN